jgi:nitric oxide reductase subunit B
MGNRSNKNTNLKNLSQILLNKKFWIWHFLIVAAISIAGLLYFGVATYTGAPPLVDFTTSSGKTVIPKQQITNGEKVFHLRGLMSYGSFWGDGAERGPDFTAEALHITAVSMGAFYEQEIKAQTAGQDLSQYDKDAINARVKRELHTNRWDEKAELIRLNDAQVYAF